MRTINEALRIYGGRSEAPVSPVPLPRQFSPRCSADDGNAAQWVVVYPDGTQPLYLCFTHYEEQWKPWADNHGSLGREARINNT